MAALPHSPSRRGISLIEVMAVLAILAVGLESTFGAIFSATRTGDRSAMRNKAVAAIQNQLEVVQALDRVALDALFTSGDTLNFAVPGLTPVIDPLTHVIKDYPGSVTRISRTGSGSIRTCLLFAVNYRDSQGEDQISLYYYHAPRR